MNRTFSINLSLLLLVSFFIHMIVVAGILMPDISGRKLIDEIASAMQQKKKGREVRVKVAENVNQNLKRKDSPQTFISDKDSAQQGYLTKSKDAKWYSETTDLRVMKKGNRKSQSGTEKRTVQVGREKVLLNDNSEMVMLLDKSGKKSSSGMNEGIFDEIKIPQPNEMSRKNTLFFSNSGLFSLNTVKFKHYHFAKRVVDRIASNWYPPVMANAYLGGYAPGSTRIMAIPPQEVKAYFVIDRKGNVIKSDILDSYGNKSLDDSCLDAIRLAKNFGPVPDDLKKRMKNGALVIPFIFGYGR